MALLTEAVGGREIDDMEGTEVIGVKVEEREEDELPLAEATPARMRETEAIVNCMMYID